MHPSTHLPCPEESHLISRQLPQKSKPFSGRELVQATPVGPGKKRILKWLLLQRVACGYRTVSQSRVNQKDTITKPPKTSCDQWCHCKTYQLGIGSLEYSAGKCNLHFNMSTENDVLGYQNVVDNTAFHCWRLQRGTPVSQMNLLKKPKCNF
jgi:hypothetical protein